MDHAGRGVQNGGSLMNFYQEVIQVDPRFTSPLECRDLALLEPLTRAAVLAIIADAGQRGIELMVTETFRSTARQLALYAQGVTSLKNVGVHHFGLACDFCKLIEGKASWAGDWSFLRDLAEKYGLISGLDWGQPNVRHSFVDPDHVQRISLKDQEELFAGTFYPSGSPDGEKDT